MFYELVTKPREVEGVPGFEIERNMDLAALLLELGEKKVRTFLISSCCESYLEVQMKKTLTKDWQDMFDLMVVKSKGALFW